MHISGEVHIKALVLALGVPTIMALVLALGVSTIMALVLALGVPTIMALVLALGVPTIMALVLALGVPTILALVLALGVPTIMTNAHIPCTARRTALMPCYRASTVSSQQAYHCVCGTRLSWCAEDRQHDPKSPSCLGAHLHPALPAKATTCSCSPLLDRQLGTPMCT